MSILSTESRALMVDSLESLLISSGGRLRGWVVVSAFFLRKEVDFPRSDECLKCRLLLLRCLASPEEVVGVAGEAGRAYFFVGEVEPVALLGGDFGGGGGGPEEDLVGEDDSGYWKYSASRSRLCLWS